MSLAEIKKLINKAEVNSSDPVEGKINCSVKSPTKCRIESVLDQGHRVFGENRIQEAQSKWPDFKAQYEDVDFI